MRVFNSVVDYPLSFLSHYLERLVRSLVYLPSRPPAFKSVNRHGNIVNNSSLLRWVHLQVLRWVHLQVLRWVHLQVLQVLRAGAAKVLHVLKMLQMTLHHQKAGGAPNADIAFTSGAGDAEVGTMLLSLQWKSCLTWRCLTNHDQRHWLLLLLLSQHPLLLLLSISYMVT